jgi:hypothetical protein
MLCGAEYGLEYFSHGKRTVNKLMGSVGQSIGAFEGCRKRKSGWHEEQAARLISILAVGRVLDRSFFDREVKETLDA